MKPPATGRKQTATRPQASHLRADAAPAQPARTKKPVGRQPFCSEQQFKLIDPVWVSGSVPNGFWHEPDNRRNYLLWLGYKLGFRRMEDWYRIHHYDIERNHGGGVSVLHWRSSAVQAVMTCFPDYDWKEWLFSMAPMGFWQSSANRRRYMEWLGEKLGFSCAEDWYRVTQRDFMENKGHRLLKQYDERVAAAVQSLRWTPKSRPRV